jgi:programmed cell death protein 5
MAKQYIEDLRKKLAQESVQNENQEFVQRQLDSAKKSIVQRYLTPEARQRLANIRTTRPALADAVETALLEASQTGMLKQQIGEMELKQFLDQINQKPKFKIIK